MYTVETVKKRINDKFGSVNRFCNIVKLNYQDLVNLFRQSESKVKQERLKALIVLVRETDDTTIRDRELSPQLLANIRAAIALNYDSQKEFCRKKKFGETWLSAVLGGKHKLLSKRVKELCSTLKIEY
jgi:hypothetical protein